MDHLRSQRRIRRSQHCRIFKDRHGQIPEAISIRERPAEVEDRAIPGHWEGDLLRGSGNSHIATLMEPRKSKCQSNGLRTMLFQSPIPGSGASITIQRVTRTGY